MVKTNAAQYPNVLESIVLHQMSFPAKSPNWSHIFTAYLNLLVIMRNQYESSFYEAGNKIDQKRLQFEVKHSCLSLR